MARLEHELLHFFFDVHDITTGHSSDEDHELIQRYQDLQRLGRFERCLSEERIEDFILCAGI